MRTENIKLSESQLAKKRIIADCIAKKMKTAEAAILLAVTQRTIEENIVRYKLKGDSAFVHGNTGKVRNNPQILDREKKVTDIFFNTRVNGKNPFERISYSFFTEILEDHFRIKASKTWVKNFLRNKLHYESPCRRRCRKDAVLHLFRPRRERFGELLQADASSHDWFGDGKRFAIHAFIDDATGIPTGLYMCKNECLLGYIEVFRQTAYDYGLPMQLYPDRAGIFFVNRKTNGEEKHLTQFGLMMEKAGVDMFPAYSPQAKGRVERFWEILQQRLPILFILHDIKTVEQANAFFRDIFLSKYIKLFAVAPKNEESAFVPTDMSEINSLLFAKYTAKTDRSGVFSFMGYRFFTKEFPNQKILISVSEKDGLLVSGISGKQKNRPVLVETDTSGTMPEVMKQLIDRIFCVNAKPRYREVYFEVDPDILKPSATKSSA